MLPGKWLRIPSWRGVAAVFRWELIRNLHAGWGEVSRGVGLLAVAGILVGLEPILGRDYLELLLPGLTAALLLHPPLRAGSVFAGEEVLPRRWRTLPVPLPWFGLVGFLPRLIVNLLGVLLFLGFFLGSGYSVPFFHHPLFWLGWVLLLPGTLGWGLIVTGLSLLADRTSTLRWGFRRLFEWLGAVFVPAASLPALLHPLHYAVPHAYLAGVGRALQGGSEGLGVVLLTGFGVSLALLLLGAAFYLVVLDRYVQRGRFDSPV